jgi:hypothetical protein
MTGEQLSLQDAAMTLLRDEILPDVLAASMVLRSAASVVEHADDDRLAEACNETTAGLTLAAEQIRRLIAQERATRRPLENGPDDIGLTGATPPSQTVPRWPRSRAPITMRRAIRLPRYSHASSWWRRAAWGSIAAALVVLTVLGGVHAYLQLDTRLGSIEAAQILSAERLSEVGSPQALALRSAAEPAPQPAPPAAALPQAASASPAAGMRNREAEYIAQIDVLTRERDEARGKLAAAQQQVSLLRGQFAKADSELAQQQQELAAQSQRVSALTECLNATQVVVLFSRSMAPTDGDKALAASDACAR